jgi:hypothetical protein
MKAEVLEMNYGFRIELNAETLEEATALVRFGLLRQLKPSSVSVPVTHPGPALVIIFPKNKNKYSTL